MIIVAIISKRINLFKNSRKSTEQAILAYDLITALEKLPSNPWLDIYIKVLDEYIV